MLVLSVLTLNFIAKKNELTKRTAYKTLLFTIFCISFSSLLNNESVIISNLCVLFAMRRIISLRSHKFVQKKIFDATFWISIATLYHFWSALFFLVIFFAILNFAANFKNWLIPFVAFFAVALLGTSFHLLVYNEFYSFWDWFQVSNLNIYEYNSLPVLVPLVAVLLVLSWTSIHYFKLIQKASVTRRPVLNIVLLWLLVSIGIAILAPTKNGSELIFFFIPFSILPPVNQPVKNCEIPLVKPPTIVSGASKLGN